jgi:hypothetical protein
MRRGRAIAVLVVISACRRDGGASAPPIACFRDVTAAAGIDFRHENGATGRRFFVETNGSGAAWLDHDGDGDLDLFLVQGGSTPGFVPTRPLRNQLLRQDRDAGGAVRFVDVTEQAGVGGDGRQGMAAAAADYDGDGHVDLYVTCFGPNVLWRNRGDGTFEDATAKARVADGDRYHASCTWGDFDRDGDLDLYVLGYVDFRFDDGKVCGDVGKGEKWRTYCHPDMYEGIDDALYRNDGGGVFADVSAQAGIAGRKGKGLGVAAADYDSDGDVDLFVANDSDVNFLWRNDSTPQIGLRFAEVASQMGVDFNAEGRTQSSMGAAFGDVDGDGDLDLFTDVLSNEYNVLWLLEGSEYRDKSYASGLAAPSLPFVGFGAVFGDFDNDGDLDLAVANGHVLDNAELVLTGTTWKQPAHLYWNDGGGRFRLAPVAEAGAYFGEPHVGRGLAAADFDDDGDLDLLFTNNHEEAHLLENELGERRSWIGFALVGAGANKDAIGAEVSVRAGGRTLRRFVRGGESYLCSHDLRVLIGLGDESGPVDARIRWPDGVVQELKALSARRYHAVMHPRSAPSDPEKR